MSSGKHFHNVLCLSEAKGMDIIMKIGVLALQGAFAEHEKVLEQLDAECIELRQARDLSEPYDALVLPGGESTVQGKLLKELGMFDTIKSQIQNGMPVLATCAGAILLAETIDGQIKGQPEQYFSTIPMCIRRNAYGRQLGSFHTEAQVAGIGTVPMTFIRAPYIASVGDGVEVLAVVEERIVGVKHKNQMAFSFHPELDPDVRIHKAFLKMI